MAWQTHFFVTEETRSGVCFTKRAFSKKLRFGELFRSGVEITVHAWRAGHRRKVCWGSGRHILGRAFIPVQRAGPHNRVHSWRRH
jgi:hypothetical protein